MLVSQALSDIEMANYEANLNIIFFNPFVICKQALTFFFPQILI